MRTGHHTATARQVRSDVSSQTNCIHTATTCMWSFSDASTRAWNSLPPTVTAASTLSSFRRHLKSHLFTKSFQSWRWLLLGDLTCCDCVKCPCSF